jgi:rubrerythrin
MDLSIYSVEDLILTARKSESEAQRAYAELAGGIKNFALKERLNFLAGEEEKHGQFFEKLYHKQYPQKEMILPQGDSPVPLPEISIDTENMPLSEILEGAMKAEMAAREFYLGLADRFDGKPEIQRMLHYIASMELGHYKILEIEAENARKFEDYDSEWPMMHVGP